MKTGLRTKQQIFARLQIKASDDDARTFTALASTWELDLGGDVIEPGAYARTLANWRASKRKLKLIDNHSYWGSVRSVVGEMLEGRETGEGLEGDFSIISGSDGDEIYQRVKSRVIDALSIGYEVMAWRAPTEEEKRRGVQRVLTEIKLVEISLVIFPMNEGALIQSVKSTLGDARAALHRLRKSEEESEEVTEDEKAQLSTLLEQIDTLRNEVSALLGSDEPKGKAPDDPEILALSDELAELELRALGTGV